MQRGWDPGNRIKKHDSRELQEVADHDHNHFVAEWGQVTLGGKDFHVFRETRRKVEASLTSTFVPRLITRFLI